MADFPALSSPPVYPLVYEREDNIIKTEMEGGYQHRRARYTRTRLLWTLEYRGLISTDIDSLLAFEASNGAGSFNWTRPGTSITYVVVLDKSIKYQNYEFDLYSAQVVLRQV